VSERSTKQRRTRRISARLSLAAATVTALILVWAILRNSDSTSGWLVWILTIGVPPIVVSLFAGAQYRWTNGTGAGAAAAAVYWVLLIIYSVRAADLYLFGALLQTSAWFIGRPRPSPIAAEGAGSWRPAREALLPPHAPAHDEANRREGRAEYCRVPGCPEMSHARRKSATPPTWAHRAGSRAAA